MDIVNTRLFCRDKNALNSCQLESSRLQNENYLSSSIAKSNAQISSAEDSDTQVIS